MQGWMPAPPPRTHLASVCDAPRDLVDARPHRAHINATLHALRHARAQQSRLRTCHSPPNVCFKAPACGGARLTFMRRPRSSTVRLSRLIAWTAAPPPIEESTRSLRCLASCSCSCWCASAPIVNDPVACRTITPPPPPVSGAAAAPPKPLDPWEAWRSIARPAAAAGRDGVWAVDPVLRGWTLKAVEAASRLADGLGDSTRTPLLAGPPPPPPPPPRSPKLPMTRNVAWEGRST